MKQQVIIMKEVKMSENNTDDDEISDIKVKMREVSDKLVTIEAKKYPLIKSMNKSMLGEKDKNISNVTTVIKSFIPVVNWKNIWMV